MLREDRKVPRELKIDRAIYLVDDEAKTYRYFRSHSDWKNLFQVENETNRKVIDGYRRVFRDSQTNHPGFFF